MIIITIEGGRTSIAHKSTPAATLTGQCDHWETAVHDPRAWDAVAMAATELHDATTGVMDAVAKRAEVLAKRRMDASPTGVARMLSARAPSGWPVGSFARALGVSEDIATAVLDGLETRGTVRRLAVGKATYWRTFSEEVAA